MEPRFNRITVKLDPGDPVYRVVGKVLKAMRHHSVPQESIDACEQAIRGSADPATTAGEWVYIGVYQAR